MAFKPLEKTYIYSQLNNDGKLTKNIISVLKDGEQLTKKDLEEQFLVITKNFKYPLKFKILEEVQNEGLIMMYSPSNVRIPLAIPFFLTKNSKGDVVGVVVVDLFGTRDKKTGSINIEAKKLYTLLESAYFAKICFQYSKQVANRNTVITNGSLVYANIIARVFNKKYALNIDKNKLNKLLFLSSKFYLLNLLGLENNEITKNYALKACVSPNVLAINETDNIFEESNYANFSKFIVGLQNPSLGFNFKDLQVRGFLESFISMYESSMLMALESFPYFLFNILSVTNGAYMNNQYVLEDIVDINGAKIYADLLHIGE